MSNDEIRLSMRESAPTTVFSSRARRSGRAAGAHGGASGRARARPDGLLDRREGGAGGDAHLRLADDALEAEGPLASSSAPSSRVSSTRRSRSAGSPMRASTSTLSGSATAVRGASSASCLPAAQPPSDRRRQDSAPALPRGRRPRRSGGADRAVHVAGPLARPPVCLSRRAARLLRSGRSGSSGNRPVDMSEASS